MIEKVYHPSATPFWASTVSTEPSVFGLVRMRRSPEAPACPVAKNPVDPSPRPVKSSASMVMTSPVSGASMSSSISMLAVRPSGSVATTVNVPSPGLVGVP